jgi:hypothetical protein
MRLDGAPARLLALAVAGACGFALVQVHRGAVEADAGAALQAAAASAGDCVGRKRAEIERLKAEGKLSAEQAMIRRQRAAAECQAQ